jgi:MFS family permease
MPPPRRPDPEPLETDDVAIVAVGTGLFFAALAVSLLLHGRLTHAGNGGWVWIFLTGGCLGLVGLVYVRRRRAQQRARAAAPADPTDGPPPSQPVDREPA